MKKTTTLSSAITAPSLCNDITLNVKDDDFLLSSSHATASRDSRGGRCATIDVSAHRFPFCLVWSPIPILTWLLPFIGHLGIADSKGVIFDFAGPYTIGCDAFAFGAPTRYLQCKVELEAVAKWDEAVAAGCEMYKKRMHNLCCDNCHSHVAVCLEHAQYAGRQHWTMVELCFWMFFRGKYILQFHSNAPSDSFVNSRSHFDFDLPTGMLAYALSRSYAHEEVINARINPQPSLASTSPLPENPDVMMQVDDEDDENDGIDFRRLRAELDRLLDEGLYETDDDEVEEPEDNTINMYFKIRRPNTTTKIYRFDRLSRSL